MSKPVDNKVFTPEQVANRYGGLTPRTKFVPLKRCSRYESLVITVKKVQHVKKNSTDMLSLVDAARMTPPESPKEDKV